jgi:TonB family protein
MTKTKAIATLLTTTVLAVGAVASAPAAAQSRPVPEAFVGTFMPHGLDGRDYVDAHIGLIRSAMQDCYESSVARTPALEGLMLVRVYVTSAGMVSNVDVVQNRTGNGDLAVCVERAVESVTMAPSHRDNVSITVPVTFRMRASSNERATAQR